MNNENRTFLVSMFLLLVSCAALVVWSSSAKSSLFSGVFGVLAFVIGVVVAVYTAALATKPEETIAEVTKTVPATSGAADGGSTLAMRKTVGR